MRNIRRTLKAALVGVLLANSPVYSGNAVDGFILGAGGGALAGQAIGRNTESTVIGGVVGGTVGYLVGNERDKNEAPASAQLAFYGGPPMPPPPPGPPHPRFHSGPPPPPPPPQFIRYGREYFRGHEVCIESVWERNYFGRIVEEVTTQCYPRRYRDYYGPDWRYHHRHWRD